MSVPGTAAITKGPQKKWGGEGDKVCENEKTHTDFTDHPDQGLSVTSGPCL